ncbi:hypothetical protein B0H14DRAFT_3434483 [Mycena olivaceomarginata]|nr:hypothetical protein B0H14DRAFT_3434483 [Mycena olivaceomarginata]
MANGLQITIPARQPPASAPPNATPPLLPPLPAGGETEPNAKELHTHRSCALAPVNNSTGATAAARTKHTATTTMGEKENIVPNAAGGVQTRAGQMTKPPTRNDTTDPAEVTCMIKAGNTGLVTALKATKAQKEVAEDEAVSSGSEDKGGKGKKNSRRTFCPSIYHEPILTMMEKHYCTHLLLPGYAHLSDEGIKRWAAYLWENWYRKSRWELWVTLGTSEDPNTQDDNDPGKPLAPYQTRLPPPFSYAPL